MAGPTALPLPGPGFEARKSKILEQLAVPDAEYSDASPKGTVDVGIRPLLAKVNATTGFVTTSSCAGRVSVFVEGRKTATAQQQAESGADDDDAGAEDNVDGPLGMVQPASTQTVAGLGGKGGGGTWLYVSHDPHPLVGQGVVVDWVKELGISAGQGDYASLLDTTGGSGDGSGSDSERRLIHFKFEPMILHVLTASHAHAQLLLRCALHAGFRESGAVSLLSSSTEPAMPIVAVRSMGLSFESLLGYAEEDGRRRRLTVSPGYLDMLMAIGHERFAENAKRIRRFEAAFEEATRAPGPRRNADGEEWEDAAARRERMRAEGLRRKAARQAEGKAEERQADINLTDTMME
ncbi:hypothetical protein LMH87_010420 [Akanthomyces muscarius]|uniref:tRNA(Phe) 7-[(3-amino-3-carboxypropyl)-4-demethylwyosine(37)-N(4)]-methyltransferase n=1 Tax=Akanthomyces muscarius TaxID=2231603 RepID=A0A9W8UMY3_AKAMU|nr:hypothetical protein LMH87_010420 [Akanthomyces muscarius]KAJ4153955.1 hypothetical protein LMH87_010420 [Akanthomyces muscarius]